MLLPERESPIGKPVSLFVTCMVDMLYPETGWSVVEVLEHLGVTVVFPEGQTCCGQPAFNSGYQDDARAVAKQWLRAFEGAEVIVAPSGSCVAMVRHEYPTLFADDEEWLPKAEAAAAKTWEVTEFIVDGLGVTDLQARLPRREKFAIHDACHGLRLLGLKDAARALMAEVENAEVHDLSTHDQCCGFGGLFSVKMADVSGGMLATKVDSIQQDEAPVTLTGDVSCMTHMNGGLSRADSDKRVRHIIDVLAEGIRHGKDDAS